MFDTFTGFHRCFTNDELYDNENPQKFKDDYMGRIVISTDKWHYTTEGNQRFYFASSGTTFYRGYATNNHEFRNASDSATMTISDAGVMVVTGYLNVFAGNGNSGAIYCEGNITATFSAVDNNGTDYIGVANADGNNGQAYSRRLFIMFNTFTGFHRCFTKDPLYNNDDPQKFKDDYIGRIVVSIGKIATDMKNTENDEWEIKYDKEGITIEDALPEIELSRIKKDKRVFGVLGLAKRGNSRPERMVINSVGEGAMWVCNSNGNIENGDYITSSNYLGYGEKQDDDLLHNYTVAKSTINCDFELDNIYYNCIELENGIRTAFIAVTYHCG